MTQIDLSKLHSSSLTPGLQDLGSVDTSASFSGTIPIGSSLTTSIPVTFPTSKLINLIRIQVMGGNLGNYWFPVMGTLGLRDFTNLAARSGGYFVFFSVQSSAGGRVINVQIQNETVGATVTLPTLTFNVHAHLYSYAW